MRLEYRGEFSEGFFKGTVVAWDDDKTTRTETTGRFLNPEEGIVFWLDETHYQHVVFDEETGHMEQRFTGVFVEQVLEGPGKIECFGEGERLRLSREGVFQNGDLIDGRYVRHNASGVESTKWCGKFDPLHKMIRGDVSIQGTEYPDGEFHVLSDEEDDIDEEAQYAYMLSERHGVCVIGAEPGEWSIVRGLAGKTVFDGKLARVIDGFTEQLTGVFFMEDADRYRIIAGDIYRFERMLERRLVCDIKGKLKCTVSGFHAHGLSDVTTYYPRSMPEALHRVLVRAVFDEGRIVHPQHVMSERQDGVIVTHTGGWNAEEQTLFGIQSRHTPGVEGLCDLTQGRFNIVFSPTHPPQVSCLEVFRQGGYRIERGGTLFFSDLAYEGGEFIRVGHEWKLERQGRRTSLFFPKPFNDKAQLEQLLATSHDIAANFARSHGGWVASTFVGTWSQGLMHIGATCTYQQEGAEGCHQVYMGHVARQERSNDDNGLAITERAPHRSTLDMLPQRRLSVTIGKPRNGKVFTVTLTQVEPGLSCYHISAIDSEEGGMEYHPATKTLVLKPGPRSKTTYTAERADAHRRELGLRLSSYIGTLVDMDIQRVMDPDAFVAFLEADDRPAAAATAPKRKLHQANVAPDRSMLGSRLAKQRSLVNELPTHLTQIGQELARMSNGKHLRPQMQDVRGLCSKAAEILKTAEKRFKDQKDPSGQMEQLDKVLRDIKEKLSAIRLTGAATAVSAAEAASAGAPTSCQTSNPREVEPPPFVVDWAEEVDEEQDDMFEPLPTEVDAQYQALLAYYQAHLESTGDQTWQDKLDYLDALFQNGTYSGCRESQAAAQRGITKRWMQLFQPAGSAATQGVFARRAEQKTQLRDLPSCKPE